MLISHESPSHDSHMHMLYNMYPSNYDGYYFSPSRNLFSKEKDGVTPGIKKLWEYSSSKSQKTEFKEGSSLCYLSSKNLFDGRGKADFVFTDQNKYFSYFYLLA